MKRRVEILSQQRVFQQKPFALEEAHLRYEQYNGEMSREIVRLSLERGDSVAALVHDPVADTVVFTEQFRYSTLQHGDGWLLEAPAGMIKEHEKHDPTLTIRREIQEEIGYRVDSVRPINTFYLSPGGTSERILLYYTSVTPQHRTSAGGGMVNEGEDIRVVVMPFAEAVAMMNRGEIIDAKTIIGLQWMLLHPGELGTPRR
ncbi:MAG: NUDIX hydrolase [Anaerolinea sp.]|nr:NUDIX hydrolase [Anaerolinea sp.]